MTTPRKTAWLPTALAMLLAAAPLAAQQVGTISGTVRSQDGQPLASAQINIPGTSLGTLSQENGRFILMQVPAGQHQVRAELLGYATATRQVTVTAGQTATVDFTLRSEAIALDEIIVTGVAAATQRAKVPFDVAQLGTDDLPVPSVNAASAIRGKVAGATVVQGSGRPGSAPSILLRGATSINASGRDQEPLYIVDGVILGSSVVDIDALDVENIEIIKGAAAASLYGSRAAAGVINITTRRGRNFDDGEIRYTVRTTTGRSDMPGSFPVLQRHWWAMNEAGTRFIDSDGSECDFRGTPGWDPAQECSGVLQSANQGADSVAHPITSETIAVPSSWQTYAVNQWPGGTFDHVDQFFDGGGFQEHYVGVTGRQGNTNFLVSFSRQDDEGVILGQDGFTRNNFRVNVDQFVRPELTVSASAFYSKSLQEGFGEGSGNPVFGLTRMQAGVNLASCEPGINKTSCINDPKNLLLNVNPTNEESANPLYSLLVQENEQERGRFLASTTARWQPTNWLDVSGDVSYDRLDREWLTSQPKGWRTLTPSPAQEGELYISNLINESLNASAMASFRWLIADRITNRTSFRYLYEQTDNTFNETEGNEFAVSNVRTFDNINDETLSAESSTTAIRADGYFAITGFDFFDRYILDALIRNDGSSLFGADERRQWYYRIAGAWRVAEEPWFGVPAIDQLKLRASRGTAGGRPRFSAQYETFNVSGGSVIPVNLGNRNLKPEHSTENEFGIDAAFLNRFDLTVTRALTSTDNQIISVPLAAFTGFSSQVQNVGTLESKTWELSLGARLLTARDFTWSARVLYDQTKSIITELNRPQFRTGVSGQNMGNVFLIREGEELGTFYGPIVARGCGDLPSGISCDEFVVNDDGFLVWAPTGLDANAWGATTSLGGRTFNWGAPFAGECTDRVSEERTNFCPVGNTMPDYSVSLSSTLAWKGLSLYGLLESVQGFDVYNQPLQWGLFRDNIDMMNQEGVPEGERKPIAYFKSLYTPLGGLVPNDAFVEDASFVKLREVSLGYRITPDMLTAVPVLRGLHGIGLNVTGRNLLTWSDYRGYDPEVGRAGGGVGSAALARVDGYNYPNFRTWTFGVELNF